MEHVVAVWFIVDVYEALVMAKELVVTCIYIC